MNIETIVNKDFELIQNTQKELSKLINIEKCNEWTYYGTEKKNIKLYTKKSEKNHCCCCAIGIINGTSQEIYDEIRNQNNWKILDDKLKKTDYIDLSDDQRVVYLAFGGLSPIISDRDLTFLETVFYDNKNIVIVTTKSMFDFFPVNNNYTRVQIYGGGWNIKNIGDNKCLVIYYIDVDLMSNIKIVDSVITKIMMSKMANAIHQLGKIVQNNLPIKYYN